VYVVHGSYSRAKETCSSSYSLLAPLSTRDVGPGKPPVVPASPTRLRTRSPQHRREGDPKSQRNPDEKNQITCCARMAPIIQNNTPTPLTPEPYALNTHLVAVVGSGEGVVALVPVGGIRHQTRAPDPHGAQRVIVVADCGCKGHTNQRQRALRHITSIRMRV
jgi:hypothetical protein